MALLYPDVRMLLEARRKGAPFDRVMTIAHLAMFLHPRELATLQAEFKPRAVLEGYQFGSYSDPFFKECLGVSDLTTVDASDYEGAVRVHDMNRPIPPEMWNSFDAVIDAGSLEHIFNVPVALANMMRAARVGGRVFITTPANNLCGHGFYQFSPELMYRVFSAENGFEIKQVNFLRTPFPGVELSPICKVYRVSDPSAVTRRVGLQSSDAAMMQVEAVKREDVEPFQKSPQQSDYAAQWNNEAGVRSPLERLLKDRIAPKIPAWIKGRLLGHYIKRRYSYKNRSFYDPRSVE
jgi:SAM-dependent methyltransferase